MRQGVKARVLISGHQMSESKVNRARRHCSRIIEPNPTAEVVTNYHISEQVSIEIQQSNGEWVLWENAQKNKNLTSPESNEVHHGPEDSVVLPQSLDRIQSNGLETFNLSTFSPRSIVMGLSVDEYPLQLTSTPTSNGALQASPVRTPSPGQFDVPTLCSYDLPSKQLYNILIVSSNVLRDTLCTQGGLSGLLDDTSWGYVLPELSLPRSISTSRCFISREQGYSNDTRRSFQLLSGEEASATIAIRALISSIMNGFVGLDSAAIQEAILSLLSVKSIGTSFYNALKVAPVHPATAFAERLFTAAIENKNQSVVKELCRTDLVDVNQSVCFYGAFRYTALERAILEKDLDMMLLLLNAGADPTNSYYREKEKRNGILWKALNIGQCQLCDGDIELKKACPQDPPYLKVLDEVRQTTGQVINYKYIKDALLTTPPFRRHSICYLFSKVSPTEHSYYFSNWYWEKILTLLDDKSITIIINNLLLACNSTQCGTCLQTYRKDLEGTLIEGAALGRSSFVKYLLGHMSPPKISSRLLCASIRGKNDDLITWVLSKEPELDPPAEDDDSLTQLSTPLAEAIYTGNDRVISLCEAAGALKHLDKGQRFRRAICMAVRAGNTAYSKHLLRSHPDFLPEDLDEAMNRANLQGFKDLASSFLDAGATFMQTKGLPESMVFSSGNLAFMRKQLNASPSRVPLIFFRLACTMDDERFIRDLIAAEPDPTTASNAQYFFSMDDAMTPVQILNHGNPYFFRLLGEFRFLTENDLTICLAAVIEVGETRWVSYLLSIGADPTAGVVIRKAAAHNPGLLSYLLNEDHCRPSAKIKHFGTAALIQSILDSADGTEALDILLARQDVDKTSFFDLVGQQQHPRLQPKSFRDIARGSYITPLGLAIHITGDSVSGYAVVKRLLDSGCDPNSIVGKTSCGVLVIETALICAIKAGRMSVVKLLVERGADVNREVMFTLKQTPLQKAAEVGKLEIIKYLLDCGADVNAAAAVTSGATALQFAAISGNINVVAELLRRGANLDVPPSKGHGRWPIEGAAEHGRIDMIDYLWKYSLVGFPERQCRRAMELAEHNGHFACRNLIQELMDKSKEPADPSGWMLN